MSTQCISLLEEAHKNMEQSEKRSGKNTAGLGLMVVNPCILGGLETNGNCKLLSGYGAYDTCLGNSSSLYFYLCFCFFATKSLIEEDWRIASVLFGVALVFGIALFLVANIKQEGKRNRYECLINNTISFVEVAENYDVVGRRGDLWILEDKVDE